MSSKVELIAAVLGQIGKISAKWFERDDLQDGASYEVVGTCHGTVNGHCFALPIDGTLTVGHESVSATSATPKQANIVAAILSKLNTVTREKVVQDLLSEYRETQDIVASEHMVEMAEMLLAGIRSQKQIVKRGDVRVHTPTKDCMISVE